MLGRFFNRLSSRSVEEGVLTRLRTPKGNALLFSMLTAAEQQVVLELVTRGFVILEGDLYSTSLDVSVRLVE